MKVKRALLIPLVATLATCVSPTEDSGIGIGVQVFHLTGSGPQAGLPVDADTLRVVVTGEGIPTQDFSRSVRSLTDLDGNGEGDRELAVEVEPETPLSITIQAKQALTTLATARVDGVEVNSGSRRYVKLTFTNVNTINPVEGMEAYFPTLPSGRFGLASALIQSDGRLLITGGFTVAQVMATCPAELSEAVVCFQLEATNEAFLLDPSDLSLSPARQSMMRARALHQATSLGDGRVLITGGVSNAVLGLVRVDSAGDAYEFRPRVIPYPAAGFETTARTFEIFDPLINREESDPGQDGDALAGGFIGNPAEPTVPGQMNVPRYLHAATLVPGSTDDVLVIGGQGAAESEVSAEVFQLERLGGSGFHYPPTYFADTNVRRPWPAAATVATYSYAIGGVRSADGASGALERWSVGQPPTIGGVFEGVSACAQSIGDVFPRYVLLGARAVEFGAVTRRVLVSGWMGPLCGASPATEEFGGDQACSTSVYSSRAFTIGAGPCDFAPLQNPVEAHFLGVVAAMPSGAALVAGGFRDGQLNVTDVIEVYTGEFDALGVANRQNLSAELSRPRAWLTATTLHGGRVAFAGGMNFNFNGLQDEPTGITLSDVIDIWDPGLDPVESPGAGE